MKRIKRHKIKTEQPESSYSRDHEEHDLAFYIHDRVELMHQVFSVLKYKELKAMAPECVRNLAIGDLQELCTEELLGISSKRLLATLDGAEPPSDTESSSGSPTPDPMETISLDSISSDEEILSQSSKKKKHKRHSKTKSKKREKHKPKDDAEETMEVSKASRAGLTVLELLELQARARAIRAQLQNEQVKKQTEVAEAQASSDDEVEIKEEEPDVVEISSGDEKPDLATLTLAAQKPAQPKEPQNPKETVKPKESSKLKDLTKSKEPSKSKELSKTKEPSESKEPSKTKEPLKPKEPQQIKEPENSKDNVNTDNNTVTRKIGDLVITVPQAKSTRQIKLKRNHVTVTVPNTAVETRTVIDKPEVTPIDTDKKKKQKKSKKKKHLEKDGSDHDEITLQLSDTEKMDLLEDLNEKSYERFSSSSDSESSSSDSDADTADNVLPITVANNIQAEEDTNKSNIVASETENNSEKTDKKKPDDNVQSSPKQNTLSVCNSESVLDQTVKKSQESQISKRNVDCEKISKNKDDFEQTCINNIDSNTLQIETETSEKENIASVEDLDDKHETTKNEENITEESANKTDVIGVETQVTENTNIEKKTDIFMEKQSLPSNVETQIVEEITSEDALANTENTSTETQEINTNVTQKPKSELNKDKNLSEGELTDRESSEVEAVDLEPEVVCISDDEKQKSSKKKKKKDKKAKKEKKSKKTKQDFREAEDQNFYKDVGKLPTVDEVNIAHAPIDVINDDDVYEILELSDDSSCYEVEGTVLSKEPTADEIEALSARIDEINQDDVVMDEPSLESAPVDSEQANEESELGAAMSWKDRYLDSKKVKKVLSTANILNALRKKNKELKKKIEQAKKNTEIETKVVEKVLEEGSIEHYQTLPSGSQYVKALETVENNGDIDKEATEKEVTKEMKKDAKQLLKIYRKLMNSKKIKRREKKKKRKLKKQNGGDEPGETVNPMNEN